MTPKEKARELIDRFSDIEDLGRRSDENGFSVWSTALLKKQAKQCALICVEEVLDSCIKNIAHLHFWAGVKTEIQNL